MSTHSSATESDLQPVAGPAHVATASFLASRATPSAGFLVALAGGTALARVAQRRGAREGYGASLAATLETVAIMGPARFGVPFTQAVSAPMLGALEARGVRPWLQIVACAAIRVVTNAIGAAFAIWVIAGGLDAYAGTVDNFFGWFGFTPGEGGTLALTGLVLLAWGVLASWLQVGVYRRGLMRWPTSAEADPEAPEPAPAGPRGRFDPRAVVLAAAAAFALLLSGTEWIVLGAVAGWLVLAWVSCRPDNSFVSTGLALGAVLAGGAFLFSLGGGLGLNEALRRGSRAALLVAVATWLRAAAGAPGLREVSRRALGRLARLPSVPEASRTLDVLGSETRLADSGRALLAALRDVPRSPVPILDAVLRWVADRSALFVPTAPAPALALRLGAFDAVLVAAAAAPVAVL